MWKEWSWILFWWSFGGVGGFIEIVEEQRCQNFDFRLTCRDLDTHIAILEAWYTSIGDYQQNSTVENTTQLQTNDSDSELDNVYFYSSPKHNGYYEPTNATNNSSFSFKVNETYSAVNETVNDTVSELEGCGVTGFARSYASWNEGGRGRLAVIKESSINLRAPLIYRCTGVNHCSFVLAEDYPPAKKWDPGVVFIKYACFDDFLSIHYCSRDVKVAETGVGSEGYIRTPGYPHFYIGDQCWWRLRVSPEQRIRVTVLDVSLRSIGPFEEECADYVLVKDSKGESLLSSCDQVELPLRLTSQTSVVDVVVETKSLGAFPKRGVLLHYKSIGCVTLPAPSYGYLVYRTATMAHYLCNENRVFEDTRQRARVIWCYEDNRWNNTVPSCVEESSLVDAGKDSSPDGRRNDTKLTHNEPNMIVDIVIPSLLIAALFIGNAFIVLVIYKYRKRKNDDIEDEFNTIPLSGNGSAHVAGNAV